MANAGFQGVRPSCFSLFKEQLDFKPCPNMHVGVMYQTSNLANVYGSDKEMAMTMEKFTKSH